MKAKSLFLRALFLAQLLLLQNLLLNPVVSQQQIPQNNIPDSLKVSLIGRWAYGPCLAVAVDATGTIACVGNGSYLEILDISIPTKPTELSKILLPAPILDIATSGTIAYVANAGAGLRIIDITNPQSPSEVNYHETSGIASGLAINGTKIYIADGESGLLPVDISIPSQPKPHHPFDTDGWASKVVISNSFAYVADKAGGLKVIDISDPANLTLAGSCATSVEVMDVAISGTYAYLAAGSAGFRVINISDPYNPSEIGKLESYQFATAIATDGLRAYLTDKEMGLRIIDISDRTKPNEIGYSDTDGNPQDIALSSGNHVLVADGHNGLRIFNTDIYWSPIERGFFPTDSSSRGVAVNGTYAYLAKGEAGLRAINIANPSNPLKVGSFNLVGRAEDVVITNNYAYLTNYENGLQIIDIADPLGMNVIGAINQGVNSKRIAIKDNYAYVADTTFGLRIVDISDPYQPGLIQSLEFPGQRADAIAIQENYAFLAAGNDGLIVVDISSPAQPNLVCVRSIGGTAISIDVSDYLAYVGTLEHDLKILNISDPANPINVGQLILFNPLYEIVVKKKYVYVANGALGLRIIDAMNPANPEERGFYITGATAYGLTLDENHIYLSCEETGLFILRSLLLTDNKPPAAPNLTQPANQNFLNRITPRFSWQIPSDENGDLLHFKIELDRDGNWDQIDYVFESKKNPTGFSPDPPRASGSDTMSYTMQLPLTEGSWHWRTAAFDGLDDGPYSISWSFTIDTTAPALNSIVSKNPGYDENWFNPQQDTAVILIVKYDELHPEMACLVGTILSDTLSETALAGGFDQEVRFNFSIKNQADGLYTLMASIQDKAGNVESKAGAIRLDATPPLGYFSDAPDTIAEGQNYLVRVLGASDSLGCGVAQIYLEVFKDAAGIPSTAQDSIIGAAEPGIYYYRYFAEDFLGNRGEIKTDTTVVTPVYAAAPIFLTAPSIEVKAGDDFWIAIQVGTEQEPVENLFAVDLILNYSNTQYVDVVSQDSIVHGNWFDGDVNLVSQIDDPNGTITIAISKKTGASNVDGFGNLSRIKYTSDLDTPDQTAIHFTIPSVTAMDSADYPIELMPRDTTIWIIQPFADFRMTVVPDSQTIHQGDSADFILSFEPLGVFDSPISLSIIGLPDGMQAIYETQSFEIPSRDTITLASSIKIEPGSYYPIITATGGKIAHTDTLTITVLPRSVLSDFSMTVVPDSQTIYQGESTEFTMIFQPIGEFDYKITLAISNLPAGMAANFPSEPVSIPDSFDVTCSTISDISPGIYEPIFTATGGGATHADTITIIVLEKPVLSDFSMTVVPDSQTIYQGESTEFTLTFQPIGEFDAQISLEISNLPPGMDAAYPSDPFTIPTSFNVIFSTTIDIAPGVYNPDIKATGGGITHQVAVKIIVLQRMDFIMIIQPDSQAVTAGDSIEFFISFMPVGGFNSPISVSVSNIPDGMDARYNSRPFSIPFSITVTFWVPRNFPAKVYYPSITATGGGITHQKTVAINVLPREVMIQDFSVIPNPFTPNNDGFNDAAEFLIPEKIAGQISISIFDISGRKITELRDSKFWSGRDDQGREVKPGAYIYIIKDSERVVAKGVVSVAR